MSEIMHNSLEEYTIPILDQIDRETGERIPQYLFNEAGLTMYVESIRENERTRLTGMIMDAIYREILRASESHDPKLVEWHMIRYGALSELLHAVQRERGADFSEPLVNLIEKN